MKYICKSNTPQCLSDFIVAQQSIRPKVVNLTYQCFDKKADLLAVLTAEQFGLCGYTGTPVDARLSGYSELELNEGNNRRIKFKNHIEHIKSQKTCKAELKEQGKEHGTDLCDDLAYNNLIAALEVSGSPNERFGAVVKKDKEIHITPLQEACENHFIYHEADGLIDGFDTLGADTITTLKLDHITLNKWRLAAIQVWLDIEVVKTPDDFLEVLSIMETPVNDTLPEFAFVISSIIKGYLNEANT